MFTHITGWWYNLIGVSKLTSSSSSFKTYRSLCAERRIKWLVFVLLCACRFILVVHLLLRYRAFTQIVFWKFSRKLPRVITGDLTLSGLLSHSAVPDRCHHAGGICAVWLSVQIPNTSLTELQLRTRDSGEQTAFTAVKEPIKEEKATNWIFFLRFHLMTISSSDTEASFNLTQHDDRVKIAHKSRISLCIILLE